ncbi:uncharacterized protein FA14DRAFT_184593 [Meira miltonrushii]|uniref:Uncharacterized protein n=1 Tax=Meira miltonrushii TaxID=1280837 RepID=A0A316VCI3_9BASI|nr:uncharacterized protein FA14DRAFT_184593 [Meira miltonrushii]PWN35377.1 hypothetical protein FA14DRAFT_184593 [Meira miltonrushii]
MSSLTVSLLIFSALFASSVVVCMDPPLPKVYTRPISPGKTPEEHAEKVKKAKIERDQNYNRLWKGANIHWSYEESVEAAEKAGVGPGNTHHKEWIKKYGEQQRAQHNFKRHKRMSKILKDHSEVSKALYERSRALKRIPSHIQSQMDQLKNKGKHDQRLKEDHDYEFYVKRRKRNQESDVLSGVIFANEIFLEKHGHQ